MEGRYREHVGAFSDPLALAPPEDLLETGV